MYIYVGGMDMVLQGEIQKEVHFLRARTRMRIYT